jgi:hypothetical protein
MRHHITALAAAAFALPALAQRTPSLLHDHAYAPDALRVVAMYPSPEDLTAPRDATVTITFKKTIDPATLNAATFNVLGRWSGPVPGDYVFLDERTIAFDRARILSAGERVTVALSRNLRELDGANFLLGYAA